MDQFSTPPGPLTTLVVLTAISAVCGDPSRRSGTRRRVRPLDHGVEDITAEDLHVLCEVVRIDELGRHAVVQALEPGR